MMKMTGFFPYFALAYIGPGLGLSAIGAFLSVVVSVVAIIFGLVWYPIRRLIEKWKRSYSNKRRAKTE